jgi:5-(carboxyamino)imidazole ribonucleotide mutase
MTQQRERNELMTHSETPLVGVVMGSQSDWATMEHANKTLDSLGISNEARVISAHRTPDLLEEWVGNARERGMKVIIAGAGMAAHLAGVTAAKTALPVLAVPLGGGALDGVDALYAMVQMPKGIPVGTLAIGKSGAINAALLAAAILALSDERIATAYDEFRRNQTETGAANSVPKRSA